MHVRHAAAPAAEHVAHDGAHAAQTPALLKKAPGHAARQVDWNKTWDVEHAVHAVEAAEVHEAQFEAHAAHVMVAASGKNVPGHAAAATQVLVPAVKYSDDGHVKHEVAAPLHVAQLLLQATHVRSALANVPLGHVVTQLVPDKSLGATHAEHAVADPAQLAHGAVHAAQTPALLK